MKVIQRHVAKLDNDAVQRIREKGVRLDEIERALRYILEEMDKGREKDEGQDRRLDEVERVLTHILQH